ncbi:MAG: hypothetical protein L6R40_002316 [Gallowayella cf. fulva]|nr:MAG: hypothetical protein L6R40_002316 [Xanthomendoza cf. fulva]
MQLLTYVIGALALVSSASAGQFRLNQKTGAFSNGCDLKIDNVCGCSKTLAVNRVWPCDKLPNVWTHGSVCGGKWQLNTKDPRHTVRFEKAGCHEGCNLNSMKGFIAGQVGPKKQGAHCDGHRY